MSDFAPHVILDAAGEPIGVYRENQDPADITRLHAVPRVNAYGEPIIEGDEPAVQMLPLDDPRTVKQLEAEGLAVDGNVLVTVEAD